MVADEKTLRDVLASGDIDGETEQQRLAALERELDPCWDLLRQRRAKAEVGERGSGRGTGAPLLDSGGLPA